MISQMETQKKTACRLFFLRNLSFLLLSAKVVN